MSDIDAHLVNDPRNKPDATHDRTSDIVRLAVLEQRRQFAEALLRSTVGLLKALEYEIESDDGFWLQGRDDEEIRAIEERLQYGPFRPRIKLFEDTLVDLVAKDFTRSPMFSVFNDRNDETTAQ